MVKDLRSASLHIHKTHKNTSLLVDTVLNVPARSHLNIRMHLTVTPHTSLFLVLFRDSSAQKTSSSLKDTILNTVSSKISV